MSGVILNPSLFKHYHCAILSGEQDQGIANFTIEQIKQFLNFNSDDLGVICQELTSYWGSIMRLDGIEVTCRLFCSNKKIRLYLIFDDNLERLETRITRLGYLFNQRAILILPRNEKVRRYTLHTQGNIFSPSYKEREFTDIDDVISYYFRYIYQKDISGIKEYKENWRFYGAGAMGKASLNLRGRKVDRWLEKIEVGQSFDIQGENKNEENHIH
ncbi:hypothetical protein PTQ27_08095 [Mannheimia sp. AT1]|uniref:DUF4123 domain-containing protein n=1 Tax=Mannheimia cairinae TaxID=3025936 RepID=A0ABT5MSI2_9PAST|nr:hypothetical protein [Mannheimia cairinae]MDD0824421.1 hypothetical protein [Mannheimia cairinae]MDD0825522.1 hypothetical protein [Mannheimia cairinae]